VFVFQEIRSDHLRIHDDTAVVFNRSHTPDEEDALEEPIEGDDLCDVKREEFDGRESCENHPENEKRKHQALAKIFMLINRRK
jgi:hypothetical protein